MFCHLNWSFYDLSGRTEPGSVNGPEVNRIQYNYLKGGEGRELVQLGQTSCMENPMIKMLIPSLDNKMKTTHYVKNHKQREV